MKVKRMLIKLSSAVLSLALLMSSLVISGTFVIAAEAETTALNIWKGDAVAPVDANGDGVYEINTPEELAYTVASGGGGKAYVLTDDIYLNDITKIDWSTGTVIDDSYSANGWYGGTNTSGTSYNGATTGITFKGTIDGRGHTVYGLYYNSTTTTVAGLIPVAGNATVTDLALKNAYVSGGRWSGGIVGAVTGSSIVNISRVYVDSTVYVNKLADVGTTSYGRSGVVGYVNSSCSVFVEDSASYATATGDGHNYGIVGTMWDAGTVSVSKCVSTINPIALYSAKAHGTSTMAVETCYTVAAPVRDDVTQVSSINGILAKNNMPDLNWDSIWYVVKDSVDYPQLRVCGSATGDVDEDGVGATDNDVVEMRKTVLGTASAVNTDYNGDKATDICDLVGITLKNIVVEEANASLLDVVYVASTGDDTNAGTQTAPVATLSKAVGLVKDGGTVNVVDTLSVTSWPESRKTVTVTGGTVDMSSLSTVNINSGVIFDNTTIAFAGDSTVYANGNTVTVNENVTVNGIPAAIYGGGTSLAASTNLTLKAGSYKAIYGGGNSGDVLGNTHLCVAGNVNSGLTLTDENAYYIYGGGKSGGVYGNAYTEIGGTVNANVDHTSHTAITRLFGGCESGTVQSDTVVVVKENAEFNYIYGGGSAGSIVKGATNVTFSAYAMSIYGGSTTGTVYETNVTVNGGWIHQVFGGCESTSMTGNTNITINGGTIDRRIVGGCYNEWKLSWKSENYVTGTCTVTLGEGATYNLKGDDHGITALSRHATNHATEIGVLVFENESLYNKLKSELGILILISRTPAYDSYSIG